ncbi:M23 family metallopeptidase [Salinifilum aidingensis]
MSRYRSPSGEQSSPATAEAASPAARSGPAEPFGDPGEAVDTRTSTATRTPATVWRGRIVVAAVAAGAFAAAGQSLASEEGHAAEREGFDPGGIAASFGTATSEEASNDEASDGAGPAQKSQQRSERSAAPAAEVLPAAQQTTDSGSEVEKLAKSERIAEERAAAAAEAARPKFAQPAQGYFTSGFGGRWGTTHYGIDIANSTGTPIVAAADGEVIEAGSASGFGMWVRVQHDDGTITVYGHVDTITAEEGQQVQAGDQIATMGNRGLSTGTHLHFEVWNPSGAKVNPLPWMQEHGISPV